MNTSTGRCRAVHVDIWLCDLCYTQQIVSAEVIPMAVGSVAEYCESHTRSTRVQLFKYPEKLVEALQRDGPPRIIGFSNYCWNYELSYGFAKLLKRQYPQIAVVMGGPNYPIDAPSQEQFLRENPAVDFCVMKEGELPFSKLVQALIEHNFALEAVKKLGLGGVHAITSDGKFFAAPMMDRIKDLSEIPSPYLTGNLDEFFDGTLMPILQTNRGCPFACTFCTEGSDYFNKINLSSREKTAAEIDYIGRKMAQSRKLGGRNDVFIADSNFGMLKDDVETCHQLARAQELYNWPEYIKVATGKNRKDRVLECSRIVNGSISLSGSVQSLDKEILANIRRSNINAQALMDVAMEAAQVGANSYAEVILGLPGDTVEKHLKTIEILVDAGFTNVYMFQLMLLPGTELFTPEDREKYKMRTHFRVIPRCFGNYAVAGANVISAEIEEIVTSLDTLSFDDYLYCRRFNLLVTVFYNDAVFYGLLKLLEHLGISRFAWLRTILDHKISGPLGQTMDSFSRETKDELWGSREDLIAFTSKPETIQRYVQDELGANLLFKYQALVTLEHLHELARVARGSILELIEREGQLTPSIQALVDDILTYEVTRKVDLFKGDYSPRYATLSHDIAAFLDVSGEASVERFAFDRPHEFQFVLDEKQVSIIERSLNTYGRTTVGMTRILARVHIKNLVRRAFLAERGDSALLASGARAAG
jgi:radical SAM superfamily enzyme YgiQ (UPF0313 family)